MAGHCQACQRFLPSPSAELCAKQVLWRDQQGHCWHLQAGHKAIKNRKFRLYHFCWYTFHLSVFSVNAFTLQSCFVIFLMGKSLKTQPVCVATLRSTCKVRTASIWPRPSLCVRRIQTSTLLLGIWTPCLASGRVVPQAKQVPRCTASSVSHASLLCCLCTWPQDPHSQKLLLHI